MHVGRLIDDIGNRKSAGTGTPGTQRSQTYGVNLLNQYTNRTVPGYLEVNGSADAAASVTVNGSSPARQGEYFRSEVGVNNSANVVAQWLTSKATNTTGTSIVARLSFTPQTPEAFIHDADGNLMQDGLWNYIWDGENRLTRIETRTNAVADSNFWHRIDCSYDYRSRRVRKQVSVWNPGTSSYQLSTSLRFFYDGWNLVGQVDEVTGTRLSFVWGTDLSGTMQGAGGVGGLKAMIIHNGTNAGTYFYSYDGNGNVAALVNATDGTEAARYEYGPFLELIRATGLLAHLNPFRASTKYQDDETQLLYYGHRYLSVVTGRWLSRDPMEEEAGLNVCAAMLNNLLDRFDFLGLASISFASPSAFDATQEGRITATLNETIQLARKRANEASKYISTAKEKLQKAQTSEAEADIRRCIELLTDLIRALEHSQKVLNAVAAFDDDRFIIDFDPNPPVQNPSDVKAFVFGENTLLNNSRGRHIFLTSKTADKVTLLHEMVHLTNLEPKGDDYKGTKSLLEVSQSAYFYNQLAEEDSFQAGGLTIPANRFSSSFQVLGISRLYGGKGGDANYYNCCKVYEIFVPPFK